MPFVKPLIHVLLRIYQEWSSLQDFDLGGKGTNIGVLAWDFLIHTQYILHVLFLTFLMKGCTVETIPSESLRHVILGLSIFSLLLDLVTKLSIYFRCLIPQRKNNLLFIAKVVNLLIAQSLFLIVTDNTLKNQTLSFDEKYENVFSFFINYFISAAFISIGYIRWDFFFLQNMFIFLISKANLLFKREIHNEGFAADCLTKIFVWVINGLILVNTLVFFKFVRKHAYSRKIFKTIINSSPVGKIIIRNKNLIFVNNIIKTKFLQNVSLTFEELSKIVFNRYLCSESKKLQLGKSRTNGTKQSTAHFIKKNLMLPEILEILLRAPTNRITLYTKTFNSCSSDLSKKNPQNQVQSIKDTKLLLTEREITTKGDFDEGFLQQIQVKVSYLDWENLGCEYIYMEFTDYSEAESIIEAEKMIEYKTHILHSFSHELKTPLNISKNMIDTAVADDSVSLSSKQKYLNPVQASLNMLNYLIHDIIDFLKIETDQLDLAVSKFDLKKLVEDAVNIFEYRLREKEIKVNMLDLSSEAPSYVYCDKIRLMRIVMNVISFIVKKNEKIMVEVTIIRKRTTGGFEIIIQKKTPSLMKLESKTEVSQVKKNYSRSPISRDLDCSPENDFGLIICKMLLENLIDFGIEEFILARVDNDDIEDEDILFKLSMSPLTELEAEDEKLISDNIKSMEIIEGNSNFIVNLQKAPKFLKKTSSIEKIIKDCYEIEACPQVLIVDDDPFNILSLAIILEKMKVKVIKAINGIEAIEVYKKHQDAHRCKNSNCSGVRVILMDLMMPVMNGMDSCRILLEMMGKREVPPVPIFACTANDSKDMVAACSEIGFAGFISKPIDPLKLKNELKDILF